MNTNSLRIPIPIILVSLLVLAWPRLASRGAEAALARGAQPPDNTPAARLANSEQKGGGTERGLAATAKLQVHQHVEEAPAWAVPYGKEFWRQPGAPAALPTGIQGATNAPPANINFGDVMERVSHAFRPEGNGAVVRSRTYMATFDEQGLHFSPPARVASTPRAEATFRTLCIRRGDHIFYEAPTIHGPPPTSNYSVLGNTAQRLLDGELGLVEHYEAQSEGVAVSWVLHKPSSGSGPLIVEGVWSELSFVGRSDQGLRYAGASGRIRVGQASLVDSAGRRWPVKMEAAGERMLAEVPQNLLAMATFPVVIDPLISPDFELDDSPEGCLPLKKDAQNPALACSDAGFLLVWENCANARDYDVYGTRLDLSGQVLDPNGIPIATGGSDQCRPAVASMGGNYVVCWLDTGHIEAFPGIREIAGSISSVLVTGAGVLGTPVQIPTVPENPSIRFQTRPAIAANETGYLVAWRQVYYYGEYAEPYLYWMPAFCWLESNGQIPANQSSHEIGRSFMDPVVVGTPAGFLVAGCHLDFGFVAGVWVRGRSAPSGEDVFTIVGDSPWGRDHASVAAGANGCLLVWEDYRYPRGPGYGRIFGKMVANGGGPIGPADGFPISDYGPYTRPVLAGSPFGFLALWETDATNTNPRLKGNSLDVDGHPIAGSFDLAANGWSPALTSHSLGYMAAWTGRARLGQDQNAVFCSPVSLDGQPISLPRSTETAPSVVFHNGKFLAVWQDGRNSLQSGWDIFGTRVSTTGEVLDPVGLLLCAAPGDQYSPAVGCCGTNWFVAWRDGRNLAASGWDIYGARVTHKGNGLDADGLPVCANASYQSSPVVAGNSHGAVVVWEDGRNVSSGAGVDIYGAGVSTNGTVLEPDGVPLITETHSQTEPALVADRDPNANLYLLAWTDDRNQASSGKDIYAARLSTAGDTLSALDGDGLPVCVETNDQHLPSVAATTNSTGLTGLIAWQDERNLANAGRDIYGSRVGTVTLPLGGQLFMALDDIPICDGTGDQTLPAAAFDGTEYFVAYLDARITGQGICASRITTDGLVRGGSAQGLTISSSAHASTAPAVASDGAGNLLLASEGYRHGTNWILGNLVSFDYPVITAQPQSGTNCVGHPVFLGVAARSGLPLSFQWQVNGGNIAGATQDMMIINAAQPSDSGTYSAIVRNADGEVRSAPAVVTVVGMPAITSGPADRTIAAGEATSFNVVATGGGTLTYQWRFHGTNIPGATRTSYTLNSGQPQQAGAYTVGVSSSCGQTMFASAILTVTGTAPFITTQPQSRTCLVGHSVTFSVSATANPAPAYQWRTNGVPIAGATGRTYTKNHLRISDSANYDVVLTNWFGALTSQVAVLSVTNFIGLGKLPGTAWCYALSASGDGSVVVGNSGQRCFRWTETNGMTLIDSGAPYYQSGPGYAVSLDGSALAGGGSFRWTVAGGGGLFEWIEPNGYGGGANAISADGTVVAGSSAINGDKAYRWRVLGGARTMTILTNTTEDRVGIGLGISADGSVIAGYTAFPSSGEAFRWTEQTGMVLLGHTNGYYSKAFGISADGLTIVGESGGNAQAFRWTHVGGIDVMAPLGFLAGDNWSAAYGASADGSVIVGHSRGGSAERNAFVWDGVHGMRNLQTVLTSEYGVDLSSWTTLARDTSDYWHPMMGVSADGTCIVGGGTHNGQEEAFIARIDSALPSTNATLEGLLLSSGAFAPDFSPDTFSYRASATNLASVQVLPTAADNNAVIQVKVGSGALTLVASGTWSPAQALQSGDNVIQVRVTAQNTAYTSTYTNTVTLVTIAPDVVTLPATDVTASNATLNAKVDTKGADTPVWFDWGTDASYGASTPAIFVPSNSMPVSVSATISGLAAPAVYHYRAVASNVFGLTSLGSDLSLTTPRAEFKGFTGIATNGDGSATVAWVGGPRLQTSTNVADLLSWRDVAGATSPYTFWPTNPAQFFRIQTPIPSSSEYDYSDNAVGYLRLNVVTNYSLLANPLLASDTSIATLLAGLPEGVSVFKTGTNGEWVVNNRLSGWSNPAMTLTPGEGWFIHNPYATNLSLLLLGQVPQGNAAAPVVTHVPAGRSLLSSAVPQSGKVSTDLGFPPLSGAILYRFYAQQYFRAAYYGGWIPGEPALALGEAFALTNTDVAADWTRSFCVNSNGICLGYTPPVTSTAAGAPGRVNFFTFNANPACGRVFDTDAATPLDQNYSAQLYAGTNSVEANFVALGAPVSFQPGGWAGYVRSGLFLSNEVPAAPDSQVWLQLRSWRSSAGATYEAALAAGAKAGKSATFPVTITDWPVPPPMANGFASFSLAGGGPLQFTSIRAEGTTAVVEWIGGGTLQEAESLDGTWLDLPGASSPCTNTMTVGQSPRFFRLRR